MTLTEEIQFWQERQDKATSKEVALVAFGIKWGLQIARDEHFKGANTTSAADRANSQSTRPPREPDATLRAPYSQEPCGSQPVRETSDGG